ncbi:biopolymer transporter ExbD [Parvibaculum sedimenti]|uniref:Biopolymer transporter ExbD n=1 Tax=Parvibaculum sedimenti TaxID=2608632 RepID=A0A6N6VJ62_9HYPH|nr:biopolymer transporter ExbD [Parvibaculum sedimenti]KAB7741316.1 biopolymer transporter ExbD [Parvibaculum sedimenti]
MAMNIGSSGDEDDVISAINTTPLVDVMLVLLIIFLITIPVAIQTVPVDLPKASNVATQTKPENIVVAVDREGAVYWGSVKMADNAALLAKIKEAAAKQPQPEIHVRGDKEVRFEFIGKVIVDCQRGGIEKVAFITEPDRGVAQ